MKILKKIKVSFKNLWKSCIKKIVYKTWGKLEEIFFLVDKNLRIHRKFEKILKKFPTTPRKFWKKIGD